MSTTELSSELFIAAYDLTLVNGVYQLSTGSGGAVFPSSLEITVSSSSGSLSTSNPVTVSAAVGELVNAASDNYAFVGTASIGNVSSGVILEDKSTGSFYYASDGIYSGGDVKATNFSTAPVTLSGAPPTLTTVCFMAGTGIATPKGPVSVETLAIGQLVMTADGRAAPVRWIGRQTVARLFARDNLPIRIKAGALAEQLPSRDLLVSPAHALLVDGVLAQAGALVNGVSILRESQVPASFIYYHVELDDHALILAENVPAETFVDNVERTVFDNWDEYLALYPDGRNVAEMELPRAKSHRQVPKALREKLAARGEALFGARVEAAA